MVSETGASSPASQEPFTGPLLKVLPSRELDLSPARYIWYPSRRVLQNTVVLFRKPIRITKPIRSAGGWLLGDSRYKLFVNGRYLQFGPAPSDPRWPEADPLDLSDTLQQSDNVLGVQVLYFGQGDGTWPMGKPGLIFKMDLTFTDGSTQQIVSDGSWQSHLATSWQPGQYKRWYLRAFQECFDARRYPYGWTQAGFRLDKDWLPAMELKGAANKPPLATNASDYLTNSGGLNEQTQLRCRSIPLMDEETIIPGRCVESHTLQWTRPVEEYFDCLTPNAFKPIKRNVHTQVNDKIEFTAHKEHGTVLTFEFPEQNVGWPQLEIEAPAGTIVELMVQEAHQPYGSTAQAPALMNNKFHSWTRFICKGGKNSFETFDYESFRWIQLHVHGRQGDVTIHRVGCRQRRYDWPQAPTIRTRDSKLQALLNAGINTIHNSGQDLIVDGMARERQQYSGDIGHMLHATIPLFGANQQAARFLNTYSQGLTKEGYFMDCWPAYDRLNRIAQRQLDLTPWGPLVDHGVGFTFDCYHYYMYTGDLSVLDEVFPRLVRFVAYLKSLQRADGLLPTEDLGTPTVWIEHGVAKPHIKCSFNLYAAAMLKHAFTFLCRAFKEDALAKQAIDFADVLLANTVHSFWNRQHRLFVNNNPWLEREGRIRLHDRSLATAILFDQCPNRDIQASVDVLVNKPKHLHLSYPANAGWYLWALGKVGRTDKIIEDFNNRWLKMPSVKLNNTLGEWFTLKPDTHNQWCHAPVAPLYTTIMNLAGIRPLSPGMKRVEIAPQLASLTDLGLVVHTPQGPIDFKCQGPRGERRLQLSLPPDVNGELLASMREPNTLPVLKSHGNKIRYALSGGQSYSLVIKD